MYKTFNGSADNKKDFCIWRGKKISYLLFRRGPVPYTGKIRCSRYYRHFHTFPEVRANSDPEVKEFVRAKRRERNLPQLWDDITISSRYDRSWKRCTKKRKQWM